MKTSALKDLKRCFGWWDSSAVAESDGSGLSRENQKEEIKRKKGKKNETKRRRRRELNPTGPAPVPTFSFLRTSRSEACGFFFWCVHLIFIWRLTRARTGIDKTRRKPDEKPCGGTSGDHRAASLLEKSRKKLDWTGIKCNRTRSHWRWDTGYSTKNPMRNRDDHRKTRGNPMPSGLRPSKKRPRPKSKRTRFERKTCYRTRWRP